MLRFGSPLFVALVVSAGAFSQSFECAPVGPLPSDPVVSCDGVASNNLGFGSGISASAACAFPTAGSQYLDLYANGPATVAAGGPFARPAPSNVTEVRIPIPAGATTISLSWEFINAEGGPQASYNDGVSADVVDASGNLVGNLFYADTHTALVGAAACVFGEVLPSGPQSLLTALPVASACDYVSIVVWNGADNAVSSRALVDAVSFNSALPPACPVPCVPAIGIPALACSSMGPGTLQVNMSSLPPNGTYLLAVTLNAGAYPNGWFYGIDIPVSELGMEINFGFPFSGPVAGGCAAGTAQIGPVGGAPSGITLYMVALGLQGAGLGGTVSAVTNAVAYLIP